MGPDIDRILLAKHVVGSEIDPKSFVFIHAVAYEQHTVAFCIRKSVFITFVGHLVFASQYVVLKSWDKVLFDGQTCLALTIEAHLDSWVSPIIVYPT
jgi:hypothetical protein